jgi:hypothetical protein
MREIKFRGLGIKDGTAGKWLIGYYVKGSTRHCILPDLGGFQYDVDQKTVGQFTGLKDKNGNEAYEKDFDSDGNMIDWCDRCCAYQFKLIDIPTRDEIFCHNCEGNFMLHDHLPDFEIIGNIYQNPELIEKQNA